MPALPWVKWYPQDWLGDAGLIVSSPAARGVWMDTLMHMAHNNQPEMSMSLPGWAMLWRVSESTADALINELLGHSVTHVERSSNAMISLVSRRMLKDAIRKLRGRIRKAKHDGREPDKRDVTQLERFVERLGNARITPDTQMLRCLEAQKLRGLEAQTNNNDILAPVGAMSKRRGGRKVATGSKAAPAGNNGGKVWAAWVDANRAAGNPDPIPAGPDTQAAKLLAKSLDADEVEDVLDAYLADPDPWLADKGHALRHLAGKVGKYRNSPSGGSSDYSLTDEQIAAIQKTERDIRAKAAAGDEAMQSALEHGRVLPPQLRRKEA